MISYSTLFHPLTLDLLIIPVAIGLGIVVAWLTKKIIVGIFVQLLANVLFDVWFWGYYYESGLYSDTLVSYDKILIYAFLAYKLD